MTELIKSERMLCELNAAELKIKQNDLANDAGNENIAEMVRFLPSRQAKLDSILAELVLAEKGPA